MKQIHRELYETAQIGFYTLDRRGRICEVNEMGARLLGFPAAWLVDRVFVVFVAKDYVRAFLDFLTQSSRNPQPRSINIDLNVGTRIHPVKISISTVVEGSSVTHRITVVDMTDTQKTERQLRESLANWHSLVRNAPDTIMTIERTGRIAFVNRSLWGYSVLALKGSNILEHIPEDACRKVRRCLDQAFRHGKAGMCEVTFLNGDSTRWYQINFGSPQGLTLTDVGGAPEIATTTLLIREISKHKRAEETLRTSSEQLRDFAARIDAVREEERTRVAREIHDELGQALTVLKLDLSWLQSKRRGAAETRQKLKGIIKQVDDTIESVRRISSELRPSILDNLGIVAAIEWQVGELQKRTAMRAALSSNVDEINLPADVSVAVFRVVQEALTNVMRHARASKAQVNLDLNGNALHISVSDNGIGITGERLSDQKSLGILGMRERISRIGGDFKLFSEPGNGARIDIIVPVQP